MDAIEGIVGALLILAVIAFFTGVFDDKTTAVQTKHKDNRQSEDIHFDPWTDEWYGTGPWWKKW